MMTSLEMCAATTTTAPCYSVRRHAPLSQKAFYSPTESMVAAAVCIRAKTVLDMKVEALVSTIWLVHECETLSLLLAAWAVRAQQQALHWKIRATAPPWMPTTLPSTTQGGSCMVASCDSSSG
jgi:hypothetical protein